MNSQQLASVHVADATASIGSTVYFFREHFIELVASRIEAITHSTAGTRITVHELVGAHAGVTHTDQTPGWFFTTPDAAVEKKQQHLQRECDRRVASYARHAKRTLEALKSA